ncbi:MAG: hypothetical protein IIZ87_05740, partial [Selenomonas sp.]|nr:hypothetical protein [Selenomonas sp.]
MGMQATKERSEQAASYTKVSNFGTETKIGSSLFQRDNVKTNNEGSQITSQIMDKAKSYYEVSNFGTETKLGSSKFQQQIKEISE